MTKEAMNLVYPQTNQDWNNCIGLTFTTNKLNLDRKGWLDPWSRPLDKSRLSDCKTEVDSLECSTGLIYRDMTVTIGSDNYPHTITLIVYVYEV